MDKQGKITVSQHVSVVRASRPIPVIASLPHSGVFIPDDLANLYHPDHLKRLRNTDWYLDQIYDFLPDLGISTVHANFSRYVIDVNRPVGRDTLVGVYNKNAVYSHDTFGEPILRDKDADLRLNRRINDFYVPYHRVLTAMVNALRAEFGFAYVLDLHSFAHGVAQDICLGAKQGNKTAPNLQPVMDAAFLKNGFTVAHNGPFSGGHITRHYGAMPRVEALQIELKYNQYLTDGTYDGDAFPVLDTKKAALLKNRLLNVFEYGLCPSLSACASGFSRHRQNRYLPASIPRPCAPRA